MNLREHMGRWAERACPKDVRGGYEPPREKAKKGNS